MSLSINKDRHCTNHELHSWANFFFFFQSNGFRVSVPSLHSTHQPASSLFSLLPQFARATTWLSVLTKQLMPNEICQESAKELDTRALGECGSGELWTLFILGKETRKSIGSKGCEENGNKETACTVTMTTLAQYYILLTQFNSQ